MCTSQSRWMTSNKPSVVYIPLFQRLIRNDMSLGSTSLDQCDDIVDVPSVTERTGAFTVTQGQYSDLSCKRACICPIMAGCDSVQVLQAVLLMRICDSSITSAGSLGQDQRHCNGYQAFIGYWCYGSRLLPFLHLPSKRLQLAIKATWSHASAHGHAQIETHSWTSSRIRCHPAVQGRSRSKGGTGITLEKL